MLIMILLLFDFVSVSYDSRRNTPTIRDCGVLSVTLRVVGFGERACIINIIKYILQRD